jgi:hypothetical protein
VAAVRFAVAVYFRSLVKADFVFLVAAATDQTVDFQPRRSTPGSNSKLVRSGTKIRNILL